MKKDIEELIETVKSSNKYRNIHTGLVEHIAEAELNKGRSWKDTVKAVRSKLHQVGAAYQPQPIHYEQLVEIMETLPKDLHHPAVKAFCQQAMQQHASTRERLPFLEQFYQQLFSPLAPIDSLMDVACGLNPLALPWMSLPAECKITVCDIYTDQIEFLNRFFDYFSINGKAGFCDLTLTIPKEAVQVALVLKTIPCLEQVDKEIGARLLAGLPAENLIVSFPSKSLGGKVKGMRQHYAAHFNQMVALFPWQVTLLPFDNEDVYLIQK